MWTVLPKNHRVYPPLLQKKPFPIRRSNKETELPNKERMAIGYPFFVWEFLCLAQVVVPMYLTSILLAMGSRVSSRGQEILA